MSLSQSDYRSLSTKPGIYLFLDEKSRVLYVGKAKNLKKRVISYFAKYPELEPKTQNLVFKVKEIKTVIASSEIEALLLEIKYIKKFKPKYNIRFVDGKNYPLIRIKVKDRYPSVLIARRSEDKNSKYFGPFPNATAMKLVLKTIRRIFPYQSVSNHPKKICLYYHLGICPCPPVFESMEFKKEYKRSIRRIIDFLNGNTKKIIRGLTKERDLLSINENFEKANAIQNKINAINLITSPFYKLALDFEVDENVNENLREKEISELKEILSNYNSTIETLKRIECFDISNIFGKFATGSMVVFINGKSNPSQYRRFKIKNFYNVPNVPNDFAMMQEVFERRIKHTEWPYPNLIIVDGGKGQVSSVKEVLKELNLPIPLIGLAKREETIVTSSFRQISLSKDSNALKLIMRIRDEAHRFAITYHRKLRSKNLLS